MGEKKYTEGKKMIELICLTNKQYKRLNHTFMDAPFVPLTGKITINETSAYLIVDICGVNIKFKNRWFIFYCTYEMGKLIARSLPAYTTMADLYGLGFERV